MKGDRSGVRQSEGGAIQRTEAEGEHGAGDDLGRQRRGHLADEAEELREEERPEGAQDDLGVSGGGCPSVRGSGDAWVCPQGARRAGAPFSTSDGRKHGAGAPRPPARSQAGGKERNNWAKKARTRSRGILENSLRGFFSQDGGGASLGPGIHTGIASSWMDSFCSSEASSEEEGLPEGPAGLLPAAAPLRRWGGEDVGRTFTRWRHGSGALRVRAGARVYRGDASAVVHQNRSCRDVSGRSGAASTHLAASSLVRERAANAARGRRVTGAADRTDAMHPRAETGLRALPTAT